MSEGEGHRYAPRQMEVDALVKVLVGEHRAMKEGLQKAREAAGRKDFVAAQAEFAKLDHIFRQHIADEEATILRLLIRDSGVEGAAEEIRIFQQHRPIYQLMKRVAELSKSPEGLLASQAELDELLELHAQAEEARVYPRARSLAGSR